MVHIVEIVVAEDALPERMNQMRVWLDHQGYAPTRFQVSDNPAQSTGCRVYFEAGRKPPPSRGNSMVACSVP